MSTFEGHACIDLRPGAPIEPVLTALNEGLGQGDETSLKVCTQRLPDGRLRLLLFPDIWSNVWLGGKVKRTLRLAGRHIDRLLVAINNDEFGAEHVVMAVHDGEPVRTHHIYVFPRDDDGDEVLEGGPEFADIPAEGDTESDEYGAILDGPRARASTAALYGVPAEGMEHAALIAKDAHKNLCRAFTPVSHWWDALHIVWPEEEDPPGHLLDGSPLIL